jgi:putative spermidine/putrescine transport system substrate-binding protein
MKRRQLLYGTLAAGMTGTIVSCQNRGSRQVFRLAVLQGSLPTQVRTGFDRHLTDMGLDVEVFPSFSDIFDKLKSWQKVSPEAAKIWRWPWQKVPALPDVVTIGDRWLTDAIKDKLIVPFAATPPSFQNLHPQLLKSLVERDDRGLVSEPGKGQIWGIPYRWGTTVIAYRRDRFAAAGIVPPHDWNSLWQPELKKKISLLDSRREIIGLTLKSLGRSYNEADLAAISLLKPKLLKLHQQTLFYSKDTYLQPLITGDTWAAVAWSNDIVKLMEKDPRIGAVVPMSGTAFWSEVIVRPRSITFPNGTAIANLDRSLEYLVSAEVGNKIALLTGVSTPVLKSLKPSEILPEIGKNLLLSLPSEIWQKSETIVPLTDTALSQYDQLWEEIRRG